MDEQSRAAHWERVYQEKDMTRVSWYRAQSGRTLEIISSLGLAQGDAALDVGSGTTVLVRELLDAGVQPLHVLDISGHALELARAQLGDDATRVSWIVGDVTVFSPPHGLALWHDRAVFHFLLDEADQRAYAARAAEAVRPGGHLLLATFAPDGPERCSGLPVQQHDADSVRALFTPHFRLVHHEPEAHTTPGGSVQRFHIFSLVREAHDPA